MKNTILLLILSVFTSAVSSQVNENGDFKLPDMRNGIVLLEGWKYNTHDSIQFADPRYNDYGWLKLKNDQDLSDFFKNDFNSFGWFRIKILVPDSLILQTAYLYSIITGAYELYANGKPIEKRGSPSINKEEEKPIHVEYKPVFFGLNSDTVVISMRYSQQNRILLSDAVPFQFGVDLVENLSSLEAEIRTSLYFMGGVLGILFALAVVHILLFIYYPKQKENLFYTLFVLTLAMIVIQLIIRHTSTLFFFIKYDEVISSGLFFILIIFMQRSLYELFRLKVKTFRYLIIIGIITFVISLILTKSINISVVIILVGLLIDVFRTIVIGIKRKLYGYKHVIIGSLILIFGLIYQILSLHTVFLFKACFWHILYFHYSYWLYRYQCLFSLPADMHPQIFIYQNN